MAEPGVDADETRSGGSRIAVIEKAVTVLDALVGETNGLTPTEVAARVGVNRSTAFRLLTSLEQTGLLARDAAPGRYRLGIKFLRYGSAVRLGMNLIATAEPLLMRLRDTTRQTVLLAIPEDSGARCILRLPGLDVDVLAWNSGEWMPLHLGAAPLALMSTLEESEIDRYLAESTSWRDRSDGRTADDLRADLTRIRDRGWSLVEAPATGGIASLATVVLDTAGSPVCTIAVAGLQWQYSGAHLEQTAAAVLASAGELRDKLSR